MRSGENATRLIFCELNHNPKCHKALSLLSLQWLARFPSFGKQPAFAKRGRKDTYVTLVALLLPSRGRGAHWFLWLLLSHLYGGPLNLYLHLWFHIQILVSYCLPEHFCSHVPYSPANRCKVELILHLHFKMSLVIMLSIYTNSNTIPTTASFKAQWSCVVPHSLFSPRIFTTSSFLSDPRPFLSGCPIEDWDNFPQDFVVTWPYAFSKKKKMPVAPSWLQDKSQISKKEMCVCSLLSLLFFLKILFLKKVYPSLAKNSFNLSFSISQSKFSSLVRPVCPILLNITYVSGFLLMILSNL